MKIELNDEQMKSMVSEAILQQLDEKKRDEVLRAAIAYLVSPTTTTDRFGSKLAGPSPLEEAFNNAISMVSRTIAREMLESDETIKAQIKQLITDSVQRMMTTDHDKYVEKIGDNIAAAMTKERW